MFQLQGIRIKLFIYGSCIEQELVGGDGKQRLGVFPDSLNIKILQVLACQDHRGILLPHTLHEVADIFHSRQIGQEQIEFIQAGRGISRRQQLIAHERKHIKKQCVL